MSCKLEEAIKDIEALASKPSAKSIAKELTQIAKEAKESLNIQPTAEYQRKTNHQMQTNSKVDTMTSKELKEKAEKMLEECM